MRMVPGGRDLPALAVLLCGLSALAAVAAGAGAFSLDAALALCIALGVGYLGLLVYRPPQWLFEDDEDEPDTDWLAMAMIGAVVISLAMALLASLAPVTGWDAAVAHIALPSDYARAGHIFFDTGNVYGGYPHLAHTLYAVAYHGGGERSVTLLNWLLAGAALWSLYALGAEIGGPRVGWIAAALLACAPIFADQAGGVSIDLPFTAFSTASLWLAARWFRTRHAADLLAAGAIAGAACGIRHTGYLCAVLMAAGVLLGGGAGRARHTALFAGAALLFALPWLGRSALYTGNPFFPLLAEWFPAGPIPHQSISGVGLHETTEPLGWRTAWLWLRFPWDIIMRPQEYDGWSKSPGGLVLILGVPGVIAGGRAAWVLSAYAVAGGTAIFLFQRLARYLLPFFAASMVIAALAVDRIDRCKLLMRAVLITGLLYGLALHAAAIHFKVPAALGLQAREDYLRARVERYPMFEYANEELTDGRVLSLDQRTYYLRPASIQNHWALERLAALPPDEQHAWLLREGIRHILLPLEFALASGVLSEPAMALREQWRADPARYALRETLTMTDPRGGATERVEVYDVRTPEDAD
jgi:4-amino-4-deoxy-L-arabinose transferase-like glycosyltransferase